MRNAGHAASTASAFQPGSSVHAVGVNTGLGGVVGGGGTAGGTATGGATGAVTGAMSGAVWQPASSRHENAAANAHLCRFKGKVGAMEWFFIEALFALAAAVAIVWWTMAPQKKLRRDAKAGAEPAPKVDP